MNNLDVESIITLDKFLLRPYQEPIWDAIENKGYRKVIVVLPRRAGKDITLWNLAIRQCLRRICLVHYVLPTYGQANRAIFSAISSTGERFIDYIPPKLIKSINTSEMKVVFKNNSVLQCVAGDTHNVSIRGTNPYMVILSEYAYMDGDVYNTVSPILAGNGGVVIMASTPYGKNHFWQQYTIAKEMPDWFVYRKTSEETNHINEDDLESEKKRMSPELFEQEYMCSFERGQNGAVFGTCLEDIKKRGQITHIMYEPGLLVHCAIDIGVNDQTTIIWFQTAGDGAVIRIIDCYSNRNLGLDHYVEILQKKPYWGRMGKFFAPHDLAVREWGGGAVTRYEKARQLGITFTILQQIDIQDSIENTMTHFPKFWIDQVNCKSLVDAIENYYKEWDEQKRTYGREPVHNWASDYCFVGSTPILTRNGMRQIIDVKDGDEVLTLKGWSKCSKSYMTRKNANLVEVKFEDGTKVKCTPDHLFMMNNEWISADKLQKGSMIRSSLISGSNTSMGKSTDYIKTQSTSVHLASSCIELYGKELSERYHQGVISITSIGMWPIIAWRTCYVWLRKTIERFQKSETPESLMPVDKVQLNGMDQKKEEGGTESKRLDSSLGIVGKKRQEIVGTAKKNSRQSLEAAALQLAWHYLCVDLPRVESVESLRELEDVYCINVPGVGHFSLSNGAIVKNCDALRYMAQAIHLTSKGITSEEFDKKRMEALMGRQPNLPYPFNQPNTSNRKTGYL